jgi:hypothetical protein
LLERLKALDIDSHSVFVTLLCAIKSILFSVADATQKTHSSFISPIGSLLLSSWIATSSVAWLSLALVTRAIGYKMRWVTIAENRKSFVEAGLFYKAVTGEIAT